jgi:TPR repeat protein
MRVLFVVVLMGAMKAHAGGELEKPEAFYIEECDNKRNAEACETMAEQTLCGQGYNQETARYMKKACAHHVFHCKQGDGPACTAQAQCILSCLSWKTYFDSDLGTDALGGCHLELKLPGETKARQTQAGVKRALESLRTACDKDDAAGCFYLGWISATEDVAEPSKAKKAWQKSCDLQSAEGCVALSNHLDKEANELKKRACELGDRSACPDKEDGPPDYLDSDSDDDGIPDSIEGGSGDPTEEPPDTDGAGE